MDYLDGGEWITGCTVIQCTPGTKAETITAYPDQSTYVIDLGAGFTRAGPKQRRGVRVDMIRATAPEVEEDLTPQLTEEELKLAEDLAGMASTGKPKKQSRESPVELKEVIIPQKGICGERLEIQIELSRNAPVQVKIGDQICPRPSRGHVGCYRVDFTPQDPGPAPVIVIVAVEPPIVHKGIIEVTTGCAEICVVHKLPRKAMTQPRIEFEVEARDGCGNPCPAKECCIRVWRGEPPVPVACGIEQGDGSLTSGSITPNHYAWLDATIAGPTTVEVWGRMAPTRLVPLILELHSPEVEPDRCVIPEEEKAWLGNAMVGQPASMGLQVFGADGKLRDAEVAVTHSVDISLEVRVHREELGSYRIEYLPQLPGTGMLHVRANGRQVAGSPFVCTVGEIIKASSQRDVGHKVFLTM